MSDEKSTEPSPDLLEMLRLLDAGFSVQSINVTFHGELANATPLAAVTLTKDFFSRELKSSEQDFTHYCFSLHNSLDQRGDVKFRRFKDLNRYWEEQERLFNKLDEKVRAVGDRYKSGQLRLDYDRKALLIDCLKCRDWGESRFLPLKRDHHEIGLWVLVNSQNMLVAHRRLYQNRPEAKPYGALVEKILNVAWQKDDTFMKRAVRFVEYADLDIDDAILRAFGQAKHVGDLHQMLAPRTPIPACQGLPHLLNGYARYCEVLRPFMWALGQAIQVAHEEPPLQGNMRYQTLVDRIKESEFGAVADCLDPAIRNADAHAGIEYDDANGRVLLTKPLPTGERFTERSYTYREASDMALRLERALFPAVLSEFAVHQWAVLATLIHSWEYSHLLMSIDNLAE